LWWIRWLAPIRGAAGQKENAMNFLEMLLLVEQNHEKVLVDKIGYVQTDAHIYQRLPDGNWEQKELTETLPDGTRIESHNFLPIVPTIISNKKKRK
jgi:hypothetical protein